MNEETEIKGGGIIVIHDKRWYRLLVPPPEPASGFQKKGFATSLMEKYTITDISRHYIICFTPPPGFLKGHEIKRLFAFFDSHVEIYEYLQKFETHNRCFYEVIFGELPQKPHFDIDVNSEDILPGDDMNYVARLLCDSVVLSCQEQLLEMGVVLDFSRDLLMYSSNGENKKSYHIVINNACHSNNKEAEAFYFLVMQKVKQRGPERYSFCVDPKVYSRKQQFRMIGCTKAGAARQKIFLESFWIGECEYKHVYDEDVTEPGMLILTMIRESLVSFVSGCSFLPNLLKENTYHRYESEDMEEDQVGECMKLLKGNGELCRGGTCPFSFISMKGSIISLKRERPSFCPLCNKTHQHENPYILTTQSRVIWNCRRRPPGSDGLLLGFLSSPGQQAPLVVEREQEKSREMFSFGSDVVYIEPSGDVVWEKRKDVKTPEKTKVVKNAKRTQKILKHNVSKHFTPTDS